VPVSSVAVLAVLAGIWLVVQGLLEIIAGFMLRDSRASGQNHGHPGGCRTSQSAVL